MKAGINLYSIRSLIQTEVELVSSLHKLRAAGYSYVQYSGAEFDAERIARAGERAVWPYISRTCRWNGSYGIRKTDGGTRAFRM